MMEANFGNHREIEFALSNNLTRLGEIGQRINADEVLSEIKTLQQRIKNQAFTLAVVGEFKRGKSTFINALLGKEILPADVIPTSATLNRVAYGMAPAVKVIMRPTDNKSEHTIEIGINELANYVTKLTPDAESISAKVKEAVVYYPIPYCKNNVSIFDTPGLNDEAKMTEVTRSVLPELDAALMVIMPNSPFAESEGAFLQELLEAEVTRILFIVTAMDRVRRAADRDKVIDLIRSRIITSVKKYAVAKYEQDSPDYFAYLQKFGQPRIYPISGYDALIAKKENDEEALEKSGFASFERILERFLVEERGAVELHNFIEQFLRIAQSLQIQLDFQINEISEKSQKIESRFAEAQAQLENQRLLNDKELGRVNDAIRRLQADVALEVDWIRETIVSSVQNAVEEADLTSSDLNKASFGAITSMVTKQGGRWINKVPNRFRKKAEEAMSAIEESGRSTAFEDLTNTITLKIQENTDQMTHKISSTLLDALKIEEKRLLTAATRSEENLSKTRSLFDDAVDVEIGAFNSQIRFDSVSLIDGKVGQTLHLSSLNSAAASSIESAKEIVSDSWESLKKRVKREDVENQWTTHDRVESFKKNFKERLTADLSEQLSSQKIRDDIDLTISQKFNELKIAISTKLEQALEETKQHIVGLHEEQIRVKAVSGQQTERFLNLKNQLQIGKQQMEEYLSQLQSILEKYSSSNS